MPRVERTATEKAGEICYAVTLSSEEERTVNRLCRIMGMKSEDLLERLIETLFIEALSPASVNLARKIRGEGRSPGGGGEGDAEP